MVHWRPPKTSAVRSQAAHPQATLPPTRPRWRAFAETGRAFDTFARRAWEDATYTPPSAANISRARSAPPRADGEIGVTFGVLSGPRQQLQTEVVVRSPPLSAGRARAPHLPAHARANALVASSLPAAKNGV